MTIPNCKSIIGFCAAVSAMFIAAPESRAQSEGPIPPRLSAPRAQYFMNHPEAWNQFLSELPARPSVRPAATAEAVHSLSGGTWTALTPAPAALGNPLLLTDGTVIVQQAGTPKWSKLTPDINGSYANGT